MVHESVAPTLALLDAEREGLLAAVQRVPAELRDRRPAAMRWSIAEVLEHLADGRARDREIDCDARPAAIAARRTRAGAARRRADREVAQSR